MDISALVLDVFSFLHQLKLYHWTTKSYARHVASDELHKSLSSLSDLLIETAIATYERPTFVNAAALPLVQNDDPAELQSLVQFKQYLVSGIQFADSDVDLMNTRDEMVSAIDQALYKFTLC